MCSSTPPKPATRSSFPLASSPRGADTVHRFEGASEADYDHIGGLLRALARAPPRLAFLDGTGAARGVVVGEAAGRFARAGADYRDLLLRDDFNALADQG